MHSIQDATLSFQATDPAIQSDTRYEDWRNPQCYEKENGLRVQEGELLLKVVVLDVNNPAAAENFPSYLPLSILIQANLNQNQFKLRDFNYFVKVKNFNEQIFKICMHFWSCKRFYIAYDHRECDYRIEEYYLQYRMAKAEKRAGYLFQAPFRQIYEEGNQKREVLTDKTLKERFREKGLLGQGGDGKVYIVERATTGDIKALKISHSYTNSSRYLFPCIQFLQTITPHLIPVAETFELDRSPDGTSNCYIMEKMEGCGFGPADHFSQVYQVQVAATLYLLAKFKIVVRECKGRNILYKKLDAQDEHKGKRLIEYDYWKYSIKEYTFYLPRPEFLIKLADYDPWEAALFNESHLSSRLEWNVPLLSQTPEELVLIFSKPEGVSEDKILEI